MLCATVSQAQEPQKWALVEPHSGTSVPVDNVGFLLAADNADAFTIVCKDGTLVSGVKTVSVRRTTLSGIGAATGQAEGVPVLEQAAGDRLTVRGCRPGSRISVYTAGGSETIGMTAAGADATISISGLPAGIYILKVDGLSVKFMKK